MKIPAEYDSLMVLGPTASGKTGLAVLLANEFDSEIISADSRQVYKELNIGSGKDLSEYHKFQKSIPYHLIDLCDLKTEFTLVKFMDKSCEVQEDLKNRKIKPVICGGSGLYLESFLRKFSLSNQEVSITLREKLEKKTMEELELEIRKQKGFKEELFPAHPTRLRLIRLLESFFYPENSEQKQAIFLPFIIGLNPEKEVRWERIQTRLISRLNEGMVEETEALLKSGVSHERLKRLGLEYKYISSYLNNELSYDEMKEQLFYEIRRFSKRQMTYFRKLEKDGFKIHWINGHQSVNEQLNEVLHLLKIEK